MGSPDDAMIHTATGETSLEASQNTISLMLARPEYASLASSTINTRECLDLARPLFFLYRNNFTFRQKDPKSSELHSSIMYRITHGPCHAQIP